MQKIIIIIMLVLITGCNANKFQWKESTISADQIKSKLESVNPYTQLESVMLKNNLSLKVLRAEIEIKEETGKSFYNFMPEITASYNVLLNTPSISIKDVLRPFLNQIGSQAKMPVEMLKCRLKEQEMYLKKKLADLLNTLKTEEEKLLDVKEEFIDAETWHVYYSLLYKEGILENWETKLQSSKDRIRIAKQKQREVKEEINRIKSEIYFMCGAILVPETEKEAEDGLQRKSD